MHHALLMYLLPFAVHVNIYHHFSCEARKKSLACTLHKRQARKKCIWTPVLGSAQSKPGARPALLHSAGMQESLTRCEQIAYRRLHPNRAVATPDVLAHWLRATVKLTDAWPKVVGRRSALRPRRVHRSTTAGTKWGRSCRWAVVRRKCWNSSSWG